MRKHWLGVAPFEASRIACSGSVNVSPCHWNVENAAGLFKHRILGPLLSEFDLLPAKFMRLPQQIFPTIGARQDLAAQANAEHRFVSLAKTAHQPGKIGQVGVGVIVDGALLAAEHDDAVI
jgi:hypothetical protein